MATVVSEKRKAPPQQQQGPNTATRPTPPRPAPQPNPTITVLPHPRKKPGGLRTLPGSQTPLPMGQRGSRTARVVKNISVRSPMLAATLFASFAVSLFCFYVTAYARVNAEGQQLSRLRQELKTAQRREIALNGEISRFQLSAPRRAREMNLIPAPPEMVEVLTDEVPVSERVPVR